jgi:CheY-like chemotaxis protein
MIISTTLEILAIDVAGKLGHPYLRRKIREFLDHPSEAVVLSARRALAQPVNETLLEDMVRSVFAMDDSSYMTNLVTVILSKEGFEVNSCNDVNKGLEALKEKRYDLLILDLNMPGMRGVDFLRRARQMKIAPRFTFILTSVRTHEDLVEVFKEGVEGVILKPFRADDLLEKVSELKESSR